MNKVPKAFLRTWLLLFLFLLAGPARADIVYPARLQLTETAPGLFEVVFVLPVINGKVLKAQPVFPDFCNSISEPSVQVDAFQKITRWQIRCTITSLHGQQIGIEGLLGSPIDIILEVTTLEGRTYEASLSPNDAYFQIPPPPGISEYLELGTLNAMRNTLWQWGLVLMFLAWLLPRSLSGFTGILLVSVAGACLGNFLTTQELLLVPSWAGDATCLLISLTLLMPYVLGLDTTKNDRHGMILIGLGALLAGGGLGAGTGISGYTPGELLILNLFRLFGVALGILLLGLLVRQALAVLSLTGKDFRLPIAKILTSLTLGVLIWKLSLFWNYPSMLPAIPWALLVFALSIALCSAPFAGKNSKRIPTWLLPAAVLGYLLGIWEVGIPFSWALILAVAAVFLIADLFRKPVSGPGLGILLTIGGITAGNYLFLYADAFLSYPQARSLFFGILLLVVGLVFVSLADWIRTRKALDSMPPIGAIVLLLLALVSGIMGLLEAYPITIDFPLSEGRLPIPYLSVLLLFLAFLLWPRHRKIHRQMGVERKAPVVSLGLLATAFFVLPVTSNVPNPWYSMDQMDQADLQQLMERKLWNTYTAFNIADEDVLFEQLADNLDEGLLDHIYLDSRRRLTMGLREGSQVTVKEVNLGALGEPEDGSSGEEGWKYPATWTVTAQVKHLKHIHYRKNQYTGTIALKPMDNGWKISEIILTSEDRQVIASGSL